MLNRIFPASIDNHYRGYKLALWLFIPITLTKVGTRVALDRLSPWQARQAPLARPEYS